MRLDKRLSNELRPIFLGPGFAKHAHGSCFVKFGDTHVLCTATVEDKVPPFLRNTGAGWVTAEYGMLPCSTHDRMEREAAKGKQSGRTQEIQRLIGRSLRAVVDLKSLGERQIRIDCDVLQADGGTRTASITGAYVALYQAVQRMLSKKQISSLPFIDQVAAVSCGISSQGVLLDLNYHEDSSAEVDANFVLTASGKIIEVQACAEKQAFEVEQLMEMLLIAQKGAAELFELQKNALKL